MNSRKIDTEATSNSVRVPKGTLMRYCSLATALFFLLCFPLSLAAEDNKVTGLVETLLEESSYEESAVTRLTDLLQQAEQKEIPAEMLIPRMQEGIAKGVPSSRLEYALQRDINNLKRARLIIESAGGEESFFERQSQWKRAANLLAGGFEEERLKTLVELCTDEPKEFRPVSLLYVSLTSWGLRASEAIDVSRALIASSIPSEEYEAVVNMYRKARRERISPEELSSRILQSAGRSRSIDELERLILH